MNERATGNEHAGGLLGHIEDMATEVKTNYVNNALGEQGAKLYDVKAFARDLAIKEAPELLKLFEDGYYHASTTDWDIAKFEDFRSLHDGKADNVGGEFWKIVTSPFRDQADEVTARDLADTIAKSEFGKNATAMLIYRKSLKEGLSISTATDLGIAMRDYKIKDRIIEEHAWVTPKELASVSESLGNAREVIYADVNDNKLTAVEFGDYLNVAQIREVAARYAAPKLESGLDNPRFDEEGSKNLTDLADEMERDGEERFWFPNKTAQLAFDQDNIPGWVKREFDDAAGRKGILHTRAILNSEGNPARILHDSPDNYTVYEGDRRVSSVGEYAANATTQQTTVAIDNLVQSLTGLLNIRMEGKAVGDDSITIQKFLDKALSVTVAGRDEGVTLTSADKVYNRVGARIFGMKESLKLAYNISDEVASNLASSLMAQSLLSGLALNDDGTYDYDTALSSPGDINYNFNTPINFNNGITAFDLIHAYASTEASGRNTYFVDKDFLFKVLLGSIGLSPSQPKAFSA